MRKNPIIKPIKGTKEYHSKQSKYEIAARYPMRSVILDPSGSGKQNDWITKYNHGYLCWLF